MCYCKETPRSAAVRAPGVRETREGLPELLEADRLARLGLATLP